MCQLSDFSSLIGVTDCWLLSSIVCSKGTGVDRSSADLLCSFLVSHNCGDVGSESMEVAASPLLPIEITLRSWRLMRLLILSWILGSSGTSTTTLCKNTLSMSLSCAWSIGRSDGESTEVGLVGSLRFCCHFSRSEGLILLRESAWKKNWLRLIFDASLNRKSFNNQGSYNSRRMFGMWKNHSKLKVDYGISKKKVWESGNDTLSVLTRQNASSIEIVKRMR